MVGFQEVGRIDSGGLGVFQGAIKILLWHQVIITGVGLREWGASWFRAKACKKLVSSGLVESKAWFLLFVLML